MGPSAQEMKAARDAEQRRKYGSTDEEHASEAARLLCAFASVDVARLRKFAGEIGGDIPTRLETWWTSHLARDGDALGRRLDDADRRALAAFVKANGRLPWETEEG